MCSGRSSALRNHFGPCAQRAKFIHISSSLLTLEPSRFQFHFSVFSFFNFDIKALGGAEVEVETVFALLTIGFREPQQFTSPTLFVFKR